MTDICHMTSAYACNLLCLYDICHHAFTCSYTTSAYTGKGLLEAFYHVAADLAGIPVTPAQVRDAAQDCWVRSGATAATPDAVYRGVHSWGFSAHQGMDTAATPAIGIRMRVSGQKLNGQEGKHQVPDDGDDTDISGWGGLLARLRQSCCCG